MTGLRKILFVTGTRADFGKLKPLMAEVDGDPAFHCQIFVTGMHMLARFGATVNEVYKAGLGEVHPYINQDSAVPSQMDVVLADTIKGLAHFVREFPPDLIVVHGDRVETLAGATVGALSNVLVAHIEGGELSGTVDELIRHAVSKLAHLHFVANEEAASRLVQMGEVPTSVHVVGSPDIDVMLSGDLPVLDDVLAHYAIPFREFGILIYHPVTTERTQMGSKAAALVEAVERSGWNFVIIDPNNDHGSEEVLEALGRLSDPARFRRLPSMRFEAFLTLLKNARAIVGNSSAGIREAPVYGVPTINVGSRQLNRFSHASITHVPDETDAIAQALRAISGPSHPSQHFGDGHSAARFIAALRSPLLWETATQKQFREASH